MTPAAVVLYVGLGAACLWGAWRRPGAGRMAATAVTAVLAVGMVGVAVVFFVESGAPEHEGTFGAEAIGLVGSMILVAGLLMAGMAVVIRRGGEAGRWLVAGALGLLGVSAVQWTVAELADDGADTGAALTIVALVALGAVAGSALLVGGSDLANRWTNRGDDNHRAGTGGFNP